MKTIYLLTLSSLMISLNCFSQKSVVLNLSHYYNEEPFELDQEVILEDSIKCKISRLEYYLNINSLHSNNGDSVAFSGIFYNAEGAAITYPGKQILVDTERQHYEIGMHTISDLKSMVFHVGVPPELNHQDPTIWDSNHPLAPQNPSMHWGWSSGYRFIALEGMVDEDSDSVYETVLQYHGVGDVLYHPINQTINVIETANEITIHLDVNYENLLADINASSGGVFHGQQDQVIGLVNNFSTNVFSNTTNLNLTSPSIIESIAPNPFSNAVQIELKKPSKIKIFTIQGRLVIETKLEGGMNTINTDMLPKGVYIFKLENDSISDSYKMLKN